MPSDRLSQLINMTDWADITTALVRQFVQETLEPYNLTVPIETLVNQWTMKHSVRWVQAQLDDEFNHQMTWAKGTTAADEYLVEYLTDLFGGVLGDGVTSRKSQRALLNQAVELADPVTLVIGEFVHTVVHSNPWWVWSIRYRHDIALIESDDDYRVKVFHEKIESGEWTLS